MRTFATPTHFDFYDFIFIAQTSATAVDLDIGSDRIRLSTNESAAASYAIEVRYLLLCAFHELAHSYLLILSFPSTGTAQIMLGPQHAIDDGAARAKFDKKSRTLVIRSPLT